MKVQYSPETKKNTAKRKRSKRKMKPLFYVCVVSLLLGIVFILMMTVFFNVNTFVIDGSSIYSREQILLAAGVEKGDNLLRISVSKVENKIEDNLPYVREAEVIRKFPSTVVINITPAEEFLIFKSDNTECIVDRDFKVLDVDPNVETELTVVRGVNLDTATEGQTLNFNSDENKNALETLISMFLSRGLSVTYYDVSDHLNLCAVIEDRIYVELGSATNLDRKFNLMQQAIEKEPHNVQMELSLKNWTIDDPKCVRRYRDVIGIYK